MRNHHIEQETQRARHLSHILKWSVVDHSLINGFLIDSDDIDVNWEYHHQILGNGGSGSSRSDFAAVIFNSTDQQFPFL